MEINPELVGIRIMNKRKEHGLSQEQLAELIDISKNHLSSIECGHNLPTVKIVNKICNSIGGSFDYYYAGKINPEIENKILKLCQKLSDEEQQITIELLKAYVHSKYKI
jgi:transcriptional regulator with XRE-family HTH domain